MLSVTPPDLAPLSLQKSSLKALPCHAALWAEMRPEPWSHLALTNVFCLFCFLIFIYLAASGLSCGMWDTF